MTAESDQPLAEPMKTPTPLGPGLISFALVVATVAVFWPLLKHDFVNYDDPYYITDNPHVQGGPSWGGIVWAFANLESGFWHPLTWLSIMLDCQLFGLRAGGHHLTSLLLHAANTVILFAVLRRITAATWRSAIVAALFAWHPLHVESVAWAAERKDVLSTFFGLLTLWAYARYAGVRRGNEAVFSERRGVWYFAALGFFACAAMSKTMVVTLPLLLLLLDLWPLQRFKLNTEHWTLNTFFSQRALLIEKLPFFAISFLAGLLTLYGQRGVGALANTIQLPIQVRVANALLSCWRYPAQMFWPRDLAVFYPYPMGFSFALVTIAGVLAFAASALVLAAYRRAPYLVVGWLWYLVTLLPVIGLIQVGGHAHADRYTYVPLIGLFVIVVWGASDLAARLRGGAPILVLTGTLVLACLGWMTRRQVQFWTDSETLFRHAIQVTGKNLVSCNCLGVAIASKGRIEEAIASFREALRFDPGDSDTHNNLGKGLLEQNKLDEATEHFREAVRCDLHNASAHSNLGDALVRQNNSEEAVREYLESLRLQPDAAGVHNSLGVELARQGSADEAISHFHSAIRFQPGIAGAHSNLGKALMGQNKLAEAVSEYQEALRLKPRDALVQDNLGVATAMQGRIEEAISHFQDALRSDPTYASAHNNLGKAFMEQHRLAEAIQEYQEALRLDPQGEAARENLARALAEQTRVEQAIAHFTELLRVKVDDPEAHYGMGVALVRQGKPEAAAAQFAEALRLRPDYPQAQRELRKLRDPGGPPAL